MKSFLHLLKTGLLFIGLCLLMITSVYGQTTIQSIGFPAEQNSFFSQNNTLSNTDGQIFTATQTGNIVSISIKMDTKNTYIGTMRLWLGLDPGHTNKLDGGLVYQTFEVAAGNVTGVITINLIVPFPIINGNIYRMEFAPMMAGVSKIDSFRGTTSTDPASYAGGIATTNGGYNGIFGGIGDNSDSEDLNFSIAIATATATAPIPTMSQWGLLIFGLLIMNISVFFVKRMELI